MQRFGSRNIVRRPILPAYRSLDYQSYRDNAQLMQDCFFDDAGNIVKRFGTTLYFDFSTVSSDYASKGGDGCYWFDERQTVIAVINGDIFEFSTLSGTYQKIATGLLEVGRRVVFDKAADNDNNRAITLFMANGGKIVYWDGTNCDLIENNANYQGTAPVKVTHIAVLDQFLFATDDDDKALAKYALVSQPFNWTGNGATGYDIPAQSKTDNINGLYQNAGRIWIQGRESIEPIQNTGRTPPFIRINGGLVEEGTVNPYALALVAKTAYFLNTNRRIMLISGYNPVDISQSYAVRMQELSSTLDVEVDVHSGFGGKTFIIFNFKDANTSIVYDYSYKLATGKDAFYEWGSWNDSNQSYDRYPYNHFTYATSWNYHLVFGRNDGKLYRLRTDKYTDNGVNIRSEVITGVYGNEMDRIKFSDILLRFRRGDGLASDKYSKSYAYFQFRKDFENSWSNQYTMDNGAIGETLINNNKIQIGSYNSIQYRVLHTDDAPFVLYGITEDLKDGI